MCGIAGIVGEGAVAYRDAVAKMLQAMYHRGPDGEGIYCAPSGACVLGHRRLSVIDLSDASSQPMLARDKTWAICYNGECYNFRELRRQLESTGETFESSGDTEVVLRLLQLKGTESLTALNAMFSLSLWNESNRELLLARDKFGQKPLYYARTRGLIVFASEIRAMLASGLVGRELDKNGLLGYLSYGAVVGPTTILQGVSLLEPATAMLVRMNGETKYQRYWMASTEKKHVTQEELRESFVKAVSRHMISDAPIGLFLSGGIDSSAITAAARKSSSGRIATFTVVFPDQPGQSEAIYARNMARSANTDHTEIPITGTEMLSKLKLAISSMDQPTSDGVNSYLVADCVRSAGLKVALSGLGGDELFGGYDVFSHVPKMLRLRRFASPPIRSFFEAVQRARPFEKLSGKWVDLLDAPSDLLNGYLARRKLFTSREVHSLVPAVVGRGWVCGIAPEYADVLAKTISGRHTQDAIGLLEMSLYMGQVLLRDADVLGMAKSLEIRSPFLDADFASLAFSADPAVRSQRKTAKWFLVDAMGSWIPKENVTRPKQGFSLPFRDWMLNELRNDVVHGLRSLPERCDVFSKTAINGIWDNFVHHPDRVRWIRPWSLFVLANYLEAHGIS